MKQQAAHPTDRTAKFHLNFLLENTEGMFVGWCIETGIAASGLDRKDCFQKLLTLTCEHIAFALENDNSKDIFQAAPPEVMNKFLMIAKESDPQKDGATVEQLCHPLFEVSPAVYASAGI